MSPMGVYEHADEQDKSNDQSVDLLLEQPRLSENVASKKRTA